MRWLIEPRATAGCLVTLPQILNAAVAIFAAVAQKYPDIEFCVGSEPTFDCNQPAETYTDEIAI